MPVFSRQDKELITCGLLLAEIKARCDALTKGPKAPVLIQKLLMVFKVATTSPGSRGPSGRRDALRKELCETPPKASDCVGAKMNLPPMPKIRGKDTPEFKEKRRILDAHNAIEKLYKELNSCAGVVGTTESQTPPSEFKTLTFWTSRL